MLNPTSPYRGKFTYNYTDFDPYWLKQISLVQEYVMAPHSQDLDRPLCDFVENGRVCKQVIGHSAEHVSRIYAD